VQKAEVELAEQFMKQLTGEFHPENLKDEYEARVEQLIESKQGQAEAPGKQTKKKLAPVIDLMEALRKSMAEAPAVASERNRRRGRPDRRRGRPANGLCLETSGRIETSFLFGCGKRLFNRGCHFSRAAAEHDDSLSASVLATGDFDGRPRRFQ